MKVIGINTSPKKNARVLVELKYLIEFYKKPFHKKRSSELAVTFLG